MRTEIETDIAIIGAGPSGLTAATELRRKTDARVLVLERESQAGGIPRHSDHPGYGIRDRHRFLSGPTYARTLAAEALQSGADIRARTMVTDWADGNLLSTTSPEGLGTVRAEAILLATGARERPRAARHIPGGRPAGVYTTGELQNAVHLHHREVGRRAVVVGGQLVSWSAVMTLKEAGCHTEALVTEHSTPESYSLFNIGGRLVFRPRVVARHAVTRIIGRRTVTGVEVEDLDTGSSQIIECDTVVFTGDWIPDNELARAAGITLDNGTKGPVVDGIGRTDKTGVFAAGNMIHPVDTADVAALNGKHVATAVAGFLDGSLSWRTRSVPIIGSAPFAWVSPNLHLPGITPARGRVQSWVTELVKAPRVLVRQEGKVITRRAIPWPASPGRVFRIPASVLERVDPAGGPVELSL